MITKWLEEQNIDILGPWPGNSPDLNPIENLLSILKRWVDKQKPTNSDLLQALIMQEWAAISQDLAQKLIESIPGRIEEVQRLFQHDRAPCHKANVITKWLEEQNIDILGPWPGNSPDLNPIENLLSILKGWVDKQKPTNSDLLQALIMQEWAAISQDLAQKFIESIPGRIEEVLNEKGQHCKYWVFACT